MKNYQKFGLVSGQVFMAFLFALVGAFVTALLTILYFQLVGRHLHVFGAILSAIIGGYIGMQTGIAYDGYKFLKQNDRRTDFARIFLQSLVGLVIGLLMFWYLVLPLEGTVIHSIISCLAGLMPLLGAILGFDLGLIQRINNVNNKNG